MGESLLEFSDDDGLIFCSNDVHVVAVDFLAGKRTFSNYDVVFGHFAAHFSLFLVV